MSDPSTIWRLDLVTLAGALRSGEVSARAAVEAHLERIAAVNPGVGAVTATLEDSALRAADAADAARARGAPAARCTACRSA